MSEKMTPWNVFKNHIHAKYTLLVDFLKHNHNGVNSAKLVTASIPSGTISHNDLLNVTANQHHAESHKLNSHTAPDGDVSLNSHKVTTLAAPAANGDAIRATAKITEALLGDATDKAHANPATAPTAYVNTSAGAGDAGKGVLLDAAGLIANSMSSVNVADAVSKKHAIGGDTTLGIQAADIDMATLYHLKNCAAPGAAGDGLRQTATATEASVDSAVSLKHTQGSDTALGAMAGDINMNTHKLTSLSVPANAGDSLRQTATAGELTKIMQLVLNSQIVIASFTVAGIVDNTATAIFTVTTPDVADDHGSWTIMSYANVSHASVAGSNTLASRGHYALYSRIMRNAGTGVFSTITQSSGTSAANDAATRDVGTITVTLVETSEFVSTIKYTVDLTGTSINTGQVTVFVVLMWDGFASAPVLAQA